MGERRPERQDVAKHVPVQTSGGFDGCVVVARRRTSSASPGNAPSGTRTWVIAYIVTDIVFVRP